MAVPGAQTLRMSLALGLLAGRSLRSTAAELARRALLLAGWLSGPASPRRLRGFQRQWFTLRRWHLALAGLLGAKLLQWAYRLLRSLLRWRERQALRRRMGRALEYDEWSQAAGELDRLEGRDCQQLERRFDQGLLRRRTASLRALRERHDLFSLMFALRINCLRNAGGLYPTVLAQPRLACPRVPQSIQGYMDEVRHALEYVATSPELPLDDKLAFLRELRHAYGRTALVLSGGGSWGFFHFGVVRALAKAALLPRLVSGSSAGSLAGALLCTHTDAELLGMYDSFPETEGLDFYSNVSAGRIMTHLLLKGSAHDHHFFQERLRRLYGDITFAEAYQRSGRVLNIAVTAADTREPTRLLNYLTAPNVLIWSAVGCSSAFPFLFAPQDLLAKDPEGHVVKFGMQGPAHMQRRWCDGSLEEDLPMQGLSEQFNTNFFLCSQCNPYLIALTSVLELLPEKLARLTEAEFKHRCRQLLAMYPHARLLKLLAQPWEGDITVRLPPRSFPLITAAQNFSPADIREAMRAGQIAVWEKLPAIQSACTIEFAIDAMLQQVTHQARAQRRLEKAALHRRARASLPRGLRHTLPSWLHMPSLGLHASRSLDEMSLAGLSPAHSTSALLEQQLVVPGSPRRRPALPLSSSRPTSRLGPSREGSREGSVHGEAAFTQGGLQLAADLGVSQTVQEEAAAEERAVAGLEPCGPEEEVSQQAGEGQGQADLRRMGGHAHGQGLEDGQAAAAGQAEHGHERYEAAAAAEELAAVGIEATAEALQELESLDGPEVQVEGGAAAWHDFALLGWGLDVMAP